MGNSVKAWFAMGVWLCCVAASAEESILDHAVVLDQGGKLQPWTSFDHVLRESVKFIENCPTVQTRHGLDPWYLVTSKLTKECEFQRNQNNQAGNAYYAVETLRRYYPYSGDDAAFVPVRKLLDRVLLYSTPSTWAWANVPRTQDNTPDGAYTDAYSEPDKMAMVGSACARFYKLSGESKYRDAALAIGASLAKHVVEGDENTPPLPFRVRLETGEVTDTYGAFMVAPAQFFDDLVSLGLTEYAAPRDRCWGWVLKYPVKNGRWAGYYEDVRKDHDNCNQQAPMESARFMLNRPELTPDYKTIVPELLAFVEGRFGKEKRFGATSICEQDSFMLEMSSHTARYASVAARWYAVSGDARWRDEARASFALATYSACSKFSREEGARNYVGVDYIEPWFSDSYFDYLCHILEGMSCLPEMAPADSDHWLAGDATVCTILYNPGRIDYQTFELKGHETFRLTFEPKAVIDMETRQPLPRETWTYGEENGVPGILHLTRNNATHVRITSKAP